MKLEQVRAIVTGAVGGLGRHFALEIAKAGGKVIGGDTNAAGLRSLKNEAANLPGSIIAARLDVTDEASVTAFMGKAALELPDANVLINSAGIIRDGLLVQRAEGEIKRMTLAQWRKVMDVNLTGPFLMTREFAAHVVERGIQDAVVVNLSSLSREGNPGQANYAASKAGLDAATRTWALELAGHGIRVGGVAPGVANTGFLGGISEARIAELAASIPVGRIGEPDEIWMAVKLIIECEYFNGRVIPVDGGARMG